MYYTNHLTNGNLKTRMFVQLNCPLQTMSVFFFFLDGVRPERYPLLGKKMQRVLSSCLLQYDSPENDSWVFQTEQGHTHCAIAWNSQCCLFVYWISSTRIEIVITINYCTVFFLEFINNNPLISYHHEYWATHYYIMRCS